MKSRRVNEDREGSPERRLLEFEVVRDQVKRRKAQFIARLIRHLPESGVCLPWDGTRDHKGYARMNFQYRKAHVTIHVHRVFMILRNAAPLPAGYEAGHTKDCPDRTCVRHLTLEHYSVNAQTGPQPKCPF